MVAMSQARLTLECQFGSNLISTLMLLPARRQYNRP